MIHDELWLDFQLTQMRKQRDQARRKAAKANKALESQLSRNRHLVRKVADAGMLSEALNDVLNEGKSFWGMAESGRTDH